eukprot:COSAG05_NODE_7221_length_841_cov_1.242588_1_plen_280_part_11
MLQLLPSVFGLLCVAGLSAPPPLSLDGADGAFQLLIEAQRRQIASLQAALQLPPLPPPPPTPPPTDHDDTALLDSLALSGGAITLEPRIYRRRGTWKLAKNNTHVRGVAGLTRLLVQAAAPSVAFCGIQISACPENDTQARCAYGQQYSRDKPLHHVYVEGIAIELIQNHSLDADGHCCSLEGGEPVGSGLSDQKGGMYGLLTTNLAYGHAIDITVTGARFQGIGLVNTASFHLIRPASHFCVATDIAINDFSFDCTITDALVTTDGWPAATNWTGQFKD